MQLHQTSSKDDRVDVSEGTETRTPADSADPDAGPDLKTTETSIPGGFRVCREDVREIESDAYFDAISKTMT